MVFIQSTSSTPNAWESSSQALSTQKNINITFPNQTGSEFYKGFNLDFSAVNNDQNIDIITKNIHRQIDLITSRLPQHIIAFAQSIPIKMVPYIEKPGDWTAAAYNPSGGFISVNSNAQEFNLPTPSNSPILAHEIMHAYQDKRAPEGSKDFKVLSKSYQEAKDGGLYPASPMSGFLGNGVYDYFAETATAAFFGKMPASYLIDKNRYYNWHDVKTAQPEYAEWLENFLL